MTQNHIGRRHQLYVGNLTWVSVPRSQLRKRCKMLINTYIFDILSQWTTDQDINDVCHEIGVSDFQDVKFFENRSNGQSKGFCLISLASESSMRLCMDRLPKKDLHGQSPVVTLPTKQALNQFESQQKTRPVPPTTNGPGPRVPGPGLLPSGPPQSSGYQSTGHQPRMMNPNGPPQYRPHNMQQQSMQGPPGPNQGPPRMQPPQMHQGGPMGGPQSQQQGPPRYQTQNQWNGPPRQNGPPRPGPPNGPPGPPQHRPMVSYLAHECTNLLIMLFLYNSIKEDRLVPVECNSVVLVLTGIVRRCTVVSSKGRPVLVGINRARRICRALHEVHRHRKWEVSTDVRTGICVCVLNVPFRISIRTRRTATWSTSRSSSTC